MFNKYKETQAAHFTLYFVGKLGKSIGSAVTRGAEVNTGPTSTTSALQLSNKGALRHTPTSAVAKAVPGGKYCGH